MGRRPQGSRCSPDLKPLVGGAPRPVVVPLQPSRILVPEKDSLCQDDVSQCVKEPRRACVYIFRSSSSSRIFWFKMIKIDEVGILVTSVIALKV